MPQLGNSTSSGLVHVQWQGIGVTAKNQMLTSQLQGEKQKNKWCPQNTSLDHQQRADYVALPKCFSLLWMTNSVLQVVLVMMSQTVLLNGICKPRYAAIKIISSQQRWLYKYMFFLFQSAW